MKIIMSEVQEPVVKKKCKMISGIFITAVVLLFLFSCKKQVEKDRPEFIGYWTCNAGDDFFFHIEIDSNSNAIYQENAYDGKRASIHGKSRATGKKLKIGRMHHFDIAEYPHEIDTASSVDVFTDSKGSSRKKANWKMTLDGPALYMGTGSYYKADY
jgi:hypothetical protein